MESENSGLPPIDRDPRLVLIGFAGPAEAQRLVAGVAAAARVVREAQRAGAQEAWLVFQREGTPNQACRIDMERVGGGIPVRFIAAAQLPAALTALPEIELVLLDGVFLVSETAIGRLLRGAEQEIVSGERIAARRTLPSIVAQGGVNPGEAPHGDMIDAGLALPLHQAGAEILRRTGKASDGIVSRWLNRPISRRISALFLRLPWARPGQATLGTALLALAMFGFLVLGGGAGLIVGGLLFHAASVFDGVDGEMARASFRTSTRGAVLDSTIDMATNLLFILGMIINFAQSGDVQIAAVGGLGLAEFAIGLLLMASLLRRSGQGFSFDLVKHFYAARAATVPLQRAFAFLITVTSRDFFALLFAGLIVAGLPEAVLYIFVAAATLWLAFVLFAFPAIAARAPRAVPE